MISLDVERIQMLSPYPVMQEGDEYLFKTDYDIVYAIQFSAEPSVSNFNAYWFELSNRSHKPSPNDSKVRGTIICIIEDFFRLNPDVLLYMCDNANDQQAMRYRLFLRWFNSYELRKKYYMLNEVIMDEGIENYISCIIPLSHPRFEEVVNYFKEVIELFKTNKP